MLRHKVKPGITGWAQVNGLRGETETLDKMRARIQCDIDTMRNGSLVFDLMIIGKPLPVMWRDQNAYRCRRVDTDRNSNRKPAH